MGPPPRGFATVGLNSDSSPSYSMTFPMSSGWVAINHVAFVSAPLRELKSIALAFTEVHHSRGRFSS
jgi:hypothetical protein